ncbi:hypothetical protein Tco_1505895 [Tanacetum coccineum]
MDDWSGLAKSFSNPIYGYFARCSLEEGLTILEGDGDMNKLYDIAEKYGLINLYIAHLPKNLTEYYFKKLTLDASDEEVKSKLKSHEKRKLDACSIIADELVLHDDWQYEGLAIDDVGGSSKYYDLLYENIIYNGHSLPNIDKERFSNNVMLDDVVIDTLAYTLSLVLK